ncbi:MAG: hypothetical protein GF317_06840 [Candidatus Lokiarchaeota archaeon]|nr:hypothetical protein [Candidatus Lokiarchaeota archaeon]MBD3199426.1 hypothetical protein [Candidatus Lokiarchaeota archaeon]
MSYRIIVDLSHKEKAEFPEFSLGEDIYEIDFIDKNEGPIEFEKLEDCDVLFIGNIRHTKDKKKDKFTPDELKAIKRFVGEGGALFLTSGAGGDNDTPMKKGSIRVLYKITGVKRFWNGIIYESTKKFMVKKHNLLFNDLYTHPITKGITELILPNSTFFSITEGDVDDLILTSDKAEFEYNIDGEVNQIGPVPVCVASEFYNGRCVTLGSSDFLLEDQDFGLDAGDNLKFFKNIMKWLTFEI